MPTALKAPYLLRTRGIELLVMFFHISGALVKDAQMKPGNAGTVVYIACDDCALELSRVEVAGGRVPKSSPLAFTDTAGMPLTQKGM